MHPHRSCPETTVPPRPSAKSIIVSVRMPAALHSAVVTAAQDRSAGLWLRDLAADATKVTIPPAGKRKRPRRRRAVPPDRQLLLREAVRSLGALGVAVVEHSQDGTLAAEIRNVLAAVMSAVNPTR